MLFVRQRTACICRRNSREITDDTWACMYIHMCAKLKAAIGGVVEERVTLLYPRKKGPFLSVSMPVVPGFM